MTEDHPTASPAADPPAISITVTKAGKQLDTFHLPGAAILNDLLLACEDHLLSSDSEASETKTRTYDWDKAKFIAKGKMLRASSHGDQPIAHLDGAKVTLQVPTVEALQSLQDSSSAARAREARRAAQAQSSAARRARVQAATTTRRNQSQDQAGSEYTFLRVEPLPGFGNAELSRAFLHRLRGDPGIRAAMRKHKFTVGLLTEMDPASATRSSHEGTTRLLGLNRNRGEAIELRLRTDAYDGYRDYRTIRDTLCHELAHNVFGPHDRDFWDLCHQIEREVQAADWRSGGRAVAEGEFYESPEDDVPDHGGWSGGTYVLGGSGSSSDGSGGSGGGAQGMNRRDIIARAAEERLRQKRRQEDPDGRGDGGAEGSSGTT